MAGPAADRSCRKAGRKASSGDSVLAWQAQDLPDLRHMDGLLQHGKKHKHSDRKQLGRWAWCSTRLWGTAERVTGLAWYSLAVDSATSKGYCSSADRHFAALCM